MHYIILDVEEESYSDEEAELYDELDPTPVEEWLPKDMKVCKGKYVSE